MCDADEEGFREEVRVTFLHELGHYIGFNEDDLEQRGLE
jgi:predicted Zn-dependent protease with MMP-like domain